MNDTTNTVQDANESADEQLLISEPINDSKTLSEAAELDAASEENEAKLEKNKETPDGVQKRIDRLVANAKMAQEKSAIIERQASERIRALEAQLQQMQRQPAQTIANQMASSSFGEPQRPNRADYHDPADYADALYIYQDKKRDFEIKQQQLIAEQQASTAYLNNLDAQHIARIEEARGRYEDFDEATDNLLLDNAIVGHPNFKTLALFVMETDKSGDMQYYLSNHKAEAKRLLDMPPHKAAIEIGKIAATLKIATPKISKGFLAPTQAKNNPGAAVDKSVIAEDARKRAMRLQKGF